MSKKTNAEFRVRVNHALDVLVEKYPLCFFPKDSTETKPLRIGIFTLITGQNPKMGRGLISGVLRSYTMKDRYLRALATCPDRVSLDGTAFGPVSESHRDYAIQTLMERQQHKMQKAA